MCLATLGAHRDSLLPVPGQVRPLVVIEGVGELPVPSALTDLSAGGGGTIPDPPPDGGPGSNERPESVESSAPIGAAATPVQPPAVPGSTLTTPDAIIALPVPTVAPEATPPSPPNPTPIPTRPFLPGPVAPIAIATPPAAGQVVNIVLTPNVAVVPVGDLFSVAVTVNAGPGKAVDAAQVYLDFDASVLQVVKLTGGSSLGEELQSNHDNTLGQINYAAGTLGAPITSPFQLLVVQFRAVAQTGSGGTSIRFASLLNPRQTKVVTAGINTTGSLAAVNLNIK